MKNQNNKAKAFQHKRQDKDTKKEYAKRLFDLLFNEPSSRRMAATNIGFTDQTYMVTQFIYDWLKEGKAEVIGVIKCSRSGRKVEKITTNPKLFISHSNNQLKIF